jgi:hypothetical protein
LFIKRYIANPLAIIFLALLFIFTGADSLFFSSGSVFVETVEAASTHSHTHRHGNPT